MRRQHRSVLRRRCVEGDSTAHVFTLGVALDCEESEAQLEVAALTPRQFEPALERGDKRLRHVGACLQRVREKNVCDFAR